MFRWSAVLSMLLLLAGTLEAEGPPAGRLSEPGQSVALDRVRSRIEIRVYRAGPLAHLGHNHVLEVLDLNGTLKRLDAGGGLAELSFRPRQMRLDEPAARLRAGDDFAQVPDAAAIAGTRDNMLGARVLDVANWPQVRVVARIADLTAAQSPAEVLVSLRGTERRYQLPLSVSAAGEEVWVSGSLLLRQSDFGISPFTALGGALWVRDEIEVDFLVVGRNSGTALW